MSISLLPMWVNVCNRRSVLRIALFLALAISVAPAAQAQDDSGGTDAGSCKLRDHIYTCDGAAFQAALAKASSISVQAHNSDGVARQQLEKLVTGKLGKQLAAAGAEPDLTFLMIPIEPSGVIDNEARDLGTLRIYSATPDGGRGHLLWAETYSGPQDTPWPLVVRGLIMQFQSHFHIK